MRHVLCPPSDSGCLQVVTHTFAALDDAPFACHAKILSVASLPASHAVVARTRGHCCQTRSSSGRPAGMRFKERLDAASAHCPFNQPSEQRLVAGGVHTNPEALAMTSGMLSIPRYLYSKLFCGLLDLRGSTQNQSHIARHSLPNMPYLQRHRKCLFLDEMPFPHKLEAELA